jgi:hypothetical protein
MPDSILSRIPVVAGLAYIERVRHLPSTFTAALQIEPDNRYFRHAVAVVVSRQKVGYLAPEIARTYHEAIRTTAEPVVCAGRRARRTDHETSGVEVLLDFSQIHLPGPA